jgi:3-mercaptopyruvate sulfurtransferase SseA
MKNIIFLVAVMLAACNANNNNANLDRVVAGSPTPTPERVAQQQPTDGVRRITTGELEELMNQGKVVVVDVRNQAAYDLGHIRGAKLIPVPQVGERTKELPRDKTIVTYCA